MFVIISYNPLTVFSLPQGEAETDLPFPAEEEISITDTEFADLDLDLDLKRYLPPEDIKRCDDILRQDQAKELEDMTRPDLANSPAVSSEEEAIEDLWKQLESCDESVDSLGIEAETGDVGEMVTEEVPVRGLCEKADHDYWHVAREKGVLAIKTTTRNVQSDCCEYLLRAVLFRKSAEYRHFPGIYIFIVV